MKTERNILIAFALNLMFSILELIGGIFTGSVAIASDALHDAGDALSIGISYLLEKKSKKSSNDKYTFGYGRYSTLGGLITTVFLIFGGVVMIYNSIRKIITPEEINYNGMIVLAVVGLCVNSIAVYFTHGGHSKNQKAVNLHMLEDVLGWIIVLCGSVVMKFTDFWFVDPLMSIGLSIFIIINAIKNVKEILELFLVKTPSELDLGEIRNCICQIEGVLDIREMRLLSMDGQDNYMTLHILSDSDFTKIKRTIRDKLIEHGVRHVTIEIN